MKCLGLRDDEVDGPLKNEPCELLGGKTPVQAMQTLGTEWGRQLVWSDLWLRAWERRVTDELVGGRYVVVDDVRFGNEANLVRSLGGELWRINRPGIERGSDHVSEAFVAECNPTLVISNNGDLNRLVGSLSIALGVRP